MASFFNSFKVAASAASLALLLGVPAGYSFARFRFKGRDLMMGFLMVVPTFPGILLAITLFVMAVKFGLYDTHYPLILANALLNLPFSIWNLRTVFEATSREIEESAMSCSQAALFQQPRQSRPNVGVAVPPEGVGWVPFGAWRRASWWCSYRWGQQHWLPPWQYKDWIC